MKTTIHYPVLPLSPSTVIVFFSILVLPMVFAHNSETLATMFRRAVPLYAAAAAADNKKMVTLHKILTGETQFKGKGLVKECNVEQQFGAGWKKELEAYAGTLKAEEKVVLQRQVARLSLTRFTTRELACFAGDGPAGVEGAAQAYNLCEGVRILNAKGDAEFTAFVKSEASLANWTDAQTTKYIEQVKAAKKSA